MIDNDSNTLFCHPARLRYTYFLTFRQEKAKRITTRTQIIFQILAVEEMGASNYPF